jgi:hypothetical protein
VADHVPESRLVAIENLGVRDDVLSLRNHIL